MDRRIKPGKIIFLTLLTVIVGVLAYRFIEGRGVRRGIKGLEEPIQTEAEGSAKKFVNGYEADITFKAEYEIEALVVHTKTYDSKVSGALAPVDLALAWGKTAEYNDRIDFNWSQSGRFYYWHVDDLDDLMPVGDVENVNNSSSNNHIIPADDSVKRTVLKIRRGDRVKLKGYLVDVYAEDGKGNTFTWNSSTTRTDTGDGACELIYVTKAEIIK
jgi:hypothetical protein